MADNTDRLLKGKGGLKIPARVSSNLSIPWQSSSQGGAGEGGQGNSSHVDSFFLFGRKNVLMLYLLHN